MNNLDKILNHARRMKMYAGLMEKEATAILDLGDVDHGAPKGGRRGKQKENLIKEEELLIKREAGIVRKLVNKKATRQTVAQ